jgi:hypothetical protein
LDSYSAAISEQKYRLIGTDTILLESGNSQEKQELEWDGQNGRALKMRGPVNPSNWFGSVRSRIARIR